MYEREEIISVALLAALCGQNTFLYGPPGTSKSLISRRIACAFGDIAYFEYLMNRFSTPEEVFGPVSIKALKEDRYVRKTGAYLPKADFAFLDEIWKASPAILNTLLTLINEHIFKNGENIETVPLKALLAASNETPDTKQGLEALFDRFIVRLMVTPISQLQNFEQLLNAKPGSANVPLAAELRIKHDEWHAWPEQIHAVRLSPETLTIVHLVREELARQFDILQVYVSDRRWQRAAFLMKAAAFFNGRTETNHSEVFLLNHCLWTHRDNYQAVADIVAQAVRSAGIDSDISLADIDRRKETLEREISKELFHSTDVYKTEQVALGQEVLRFDEPEKFQYWDYYANGPLFLPYKNMKSVHEFHPIDKSGNAIEQVTCKFDGQGSCSATERRSGRVVTFSPRVLFHKGDKKVDINDRLIASLSQSVSDVKAELNEILKQVSKRFSEIEHEFDSLFVPAEKSRQAIAGIAAQIDDLQLRVKDCERLEGLCC